MNPPEPEATESLDFAQQIATVIYPWPQDEQKRDVLVYLLRAFAEEIRRSPPK